MQRIHILTLVLAATLLISVARPLAAESLTAAEQTTAGLLETPAPFYHDYNLSVLFPVGASLSQAAAGQTEAGAGKNLSLRECIEFALANSPNHRKAKENLRASTAQLLSAWGNYIPTLRSSFGLSQNNRNSSFVDPSGTIHTTGGISKSAYGALSFNFPLFDRGQKYFEMKNARFFKSERFSRLYSSELGLVNQVRQAYFNVLRDKKLLLAGQRQADQQREQQRLAEARFAVGSVTRLDVLQAQLGVHNADLQTVQFQNDLSNARMNLNQAMGGRLNEDFSLVDEFEVVKPELDAEALIQEAMEKHPDIKTLLLQINQQQNNLWMGRLAYLPSLGTGASFSRSADRLDFFPNQVQSRGLNFSMSWDILDSFSRFSQNRNTEIALNNLRYDLAALHLDVERRIRGDLLELDRLYQRHLNLGESEQLANQSLELQQERYRLGASSLLDLRQAQVDQAQAEINYINSIYDYQIVYSRLSLDVGRDMSGMFGN